MSFTYIEQSAVRSMRGILTRSVEQNMASQVDLLRCTACTVVSFKDDHEANFRTALSLPDGVLIGVFSFYLDSFCKLVFLCKVHMLSSWGLSPSSPRYGTPPSQHTFFLDPNLSRGCSTVSGISIICMYTDLGLERVTVVM